MQGYVLEGYPKTDGQTIAMKDTHLQPTLIVHLQGGNLNPAVSKDLQEKFQNVVLKLAEDNSAEEMFEKVCF